MKIKYGYCKDCEQNFFNFEHHNMGWCRCGNSGVDIEDLYTRAVGNVEIRDSEISEVIEDIKKEQEWKQEKESGSTT
jgi:hypothetical protein